MPLNAMPTRRSLLVKLALGAACLAAKTKPALAKAPPRVEQSSEARFAVDLVHATMPHDQSAARIGAAYLRIAPQEDHLAWLVKALKTRDSNLEHFVNSRRPERARATISHRIALDFKHGDVVEVDGWVISLTEGRLAALARMVRNLSPIA